MGVGGSCQTTGATADGSARAAVTRPELEQLQLSSESSPNELLVCHQCGQIHAGSRLVTLPDGRVVGSYSEEYRRHCEAKWVLKKKRTKNTRQAYLVAVQEQRGQQAAYELREEMKLVWEWQQQQK